jgi:3-deoxy-7-phosphoheptulonate synthase
MQRLPIIGTAAEELIRATRRNISAIIHGRDDRLLVIIGPCSIHDPLAAREYAQSLREERLQYLPHLEIVMRVYFEKPRTSIGWKGLINDPGLDESFRIEDGLSIARKLLIDINSIGVPAGGEFLDVISPQYLGDLVSWGAIGARTTESQVHRQLASGLSAPIGFKNGTDGNVVIAVDAVRAAAGPHHFLSVLKSGQVAIVESAGNTDCHVILRGGDRPNYDAASVEMACFELERRQLPGRVMVDCSHGNSGKQHERQIEVALDVATQIASGSVRILGVMIESNLRAGSQTVNVGANGPAGLIYGQSITDSCIGWEDTFRLLESLNAAVKERRGQAPHAIRSSFIAPSP